MMIDDKTYKEQCCNNLQIPCVTVCSSYFTECSKSNILIIFEYP